MITKVRFPHAMDVRGDLHVRSTWSIGDRDLVEVIPLRGSADTVIFVFPEGERRIVVLPRGTIVHEHKPPHPGE